MGNNNGCIFQSANSAATPEQQLMGSSFFTRYIAKLAKTPDQKKCLDFFLKPDGCMSGKMSIDEYKQMVYQLLNRQDYRAKAIYKLGIDPSQCNLVQPIVLTSFRYGSGEYEFAYAKDTEVVTNKFSLTWLFFGVSCMYAYNIIFDTTSDTTVEKTSEIHYKDIVKVEAWQKNKELMLRSGCLQKGCLLVAPDKYIITYDLFRVSVPGQELAFGMKNNPKLENSIMGVKQLIRDKKLAN